MSETSSENTFEFDIVQSQLQSWGIQDTVFLLMKNGPDIVSDIVFPLVLVIIFKKKPEQA